MKICDTNTHLLSTLLILFIVLPPPVNSGITFRLAKGTTCFDLPNSSPRQSAMASALLCHPQPALANGGHSPYAENLSFIQLLHIVSYNWRQKWLICVLMRTYKKPQSLGRRKILTLLSFPLCPHISAVNRRVEAKFFISSLLPL